MGVEICWVLLSVAKAPHSGGLDLAHVGPSKPDSPSLPEKGRHSDPRAEPRTGRQWLIRVQARESGRAGLTPVLTPAAWCGQMSSAPQPQFPLICKSMSITILTLPGHCKDSVKIMYEAGRNA